MEGHSDTVTEVAISPDGSLAMSGSRDRTIRLWDLASGRDVRTFAWHSARIDSLAFGPDGRLGISASRDGTVRLWQTSGRELVRMVAFRDGSFLTITPEGFFDASSPEAARNLNIVRGMEVSSAEQVYNALYRPDLVRESLAGDPDGKVRAAAARLDLEHVMASGMAPRVAITSPQSGSPIQTDQVTVDAAITDQGGGIGRIEWRVNGVTLGLGARGFKRVNEPAAFAGEAVSRALLLAPGDNRIELVAYNAQGLIASEPASITLTWNGAGPATPPKLHVLAVAVNEYFDSRLRLRYAVPDATALTEGFRKAGQGLYSSVEVTTVLDRDATLASLDRVFSELSQKVQPQDVFVFFLAGHGKTRNGRYYFLPYDFRYQDEDSIEKAGVGQDRLQAWLAAIPARKALLLYDSCESGSLTAAGTRGSDIEERLGAVNRMARATGRIVLTATTDDSPAQEGYRGHGVFTFAILDAFAHAVSRHDGLIEVSGLADYLDDKVPEISYEAFSLRQVPQRSMQGSNFTLVRKTDVLQAPSTPVQVGTAAADTRPTHVVLAPVDARISASDNAAATAHLVPGTQVHVLETAGGWSLIARGGSKLGYVRDNAVAGLQ